MTLPCAIDVGPEACSDLHRHKAIALGAKLLQTMIINGWIWLCVPDV